MKKQILKSLAVLAAVTMLAGCGKTVSYQDHLNDYVKEMDYHDGFTILQLTDIHWNTATQVGDNTYGEKEYLMKVIKEAEKHAGKIDLIEITGDTFMLANKRAVETFIDFMEEVGIPYAMTWGNHDREGTYNPNWISKKFMNAPYSLYTEIDNDDVHERSNYIINLKNEDGSTAWQLTHLDSGASYRDGAADIGLTYDYIREDQLQWMKAEHDAAGANVPVICYYHIPQKDFDVAYENIVADSNATPNKTATGYTYMFFKNEGFSKSSYAGTLKEACLECNVKANFIGHDHSNDFTFTTPDGIVFGYGVKTGKELYYTDSGKNQLYEGFDLAEDIDVIGASLVTLNDTEGNFTLEHLYLNERENKDIVQWVLYK